MDKGRREATLDLGPTETDTRGRGCSRTLRCICSRGYQGLCPYCTLDALLEVGKKRGLGPKHPLFPTRKGVAATARAVRLTLRLLSGRWLGEHSLRREGAQMYVRRFVALPLVQFLGRWGGPTVAKYAGEALQTQLAVAASASAAGAAPAGSAGPSKLLRKTIEELIDEALAQRLPRESADPLLLAFQSSSAVPGAPDLPPVRRVRGMKGAAEAGEVHDAVICDPAIPREGWVTRCSWRFGRSSFIFKDGAEATCARCLSSRQVEARRLSLVG